MSDRNTVELLCRQVSPSFGYDPLLILAVCEQESAYDSTQVRLENGFYRNYSRPAEFATTTEVLFAASYGLMQTMGYSLYQLGMFEPVTQVGVVKGIDNYMILPELQVKMGCAWLMVKELTSIGKCEPEAVATVQEHLHQVYELHQAHGRPWRNPQDMLMRDALRRYNGRAVYANEVLSRYTALVKLSTGKVV